MVEFPVRNAKRFGMLFALCLLGLSSSLAVAQSCRCNQDRQFGSCRLQDLSLTNTPPSPTPGPALVIDQGGVSFVFIVDLFSGDTNIYDGGSLLVGQPTRFPSPRGTATTAGVAHDPNRRVLYWAIDGKIVVTHVPNLDLDPAGLVIQLDDLGQPREPGFDDVLDDDGNPIVLDVDLDDLANRLYGSTERSGSLGGITYHEGRNQIWALDFVNDVYFEISRDDGSLIMEGNSPVHFFSPSSSAEIPNGYGNDFTYARTEDGDEYFDIVIGRFAEGRPTRVERLFAPSDDSGGIGGLAGLGYDLFDGLINETIPGGPFVTGIAFWPTACAGQKGSEIIIAYDQAGDGRHSFVEINAQTPKVRNVINLNCAVAGGGNQVDLTWVNQGGFEVIEIYRMSLSNPGNETMVFSSTAAEDPERFTDTTLPIPVDGTYEYRASATAMDDDQNELRTLDTKCLVTVGRGELLGCRTLITDESTVSFAPSALTIAGSDLYVVDIVSNVAQRVDPETLRTSSGVVGPFAALGGTVTGLSHNPTTNRFTWLGKISGVAQIQITNLDGGGAFSRFFVQSPPQFIGQADFGDLAYDGTKDYYWAVDIRHDAIFAIREDGSVVPDTVIMNPLGRILGGGIAVVESDAFSVTLDIVAGDGNNADSIVRNKYTLSDLGNPEEIQVIFSGLLTGSAKPGGTQAATINGQDQVFLVSTDIFEICTFSDENAILTDLPFIRGDSNNDGSVNISDPSFTLSSLFKNGPASPCLNAADFNDDNAVNISDAVASFNFLFRSGSPPPVPGLVCGFDPTSPDALECEDTACIGEG